MSLLLGAGAVHDAAALNETRTLSFHHTHSGEDLTVTFKRDGRYDEAALRELNHFLRDWRSQEQTTMDRHLFDILWEVYRDVDGTKPIQIISAYRSPATNAMLRRRSSGVARFSQHMLGHAMDFFIPDVPLEKIRFAGLRLQRGGVGFYPTSGSPFVHLDTGSIRHWPRMTHEQLARVFPDGRTVHVPSDGIPLKGYELARAAIEQRDDGDGASTKTPPSLFALLFRGGSNEAEDEASSASPARASSVTTSLVSTAREKSVADQTLDKPNAAKPSLRAKAAARNLQFATADAEVAQLRPSEAASGTVDARPPTPVDIINSRGFWDETDPSGPKPQLTQAKLAAVGARKALSSSVDPLSTASIATLSALAYAPPPASQSDRAAVVSDNTSNQRIRAAALAHSPMVTAAAVDPVTAKGQAKELTKELTKELVKEPLGLGSVVATSTRMASSTSNNTWIRAMMLAPSASVSMSVTVLGDTDMSSMRVHFVKPDAVIIMGFSDDPQMGLLNDRFTGSAMAALPTQLFAARTTTSP
jgi:uncharacterized protein YcbK (DUF882 family)